jgi:membrane protein insertase Oxa1/YidC/SpoIIIJ
VLTSGAVVIRSALFPLVIKLQRELINTSNTMPGLVKLQQQFMAAQAAGDNEKMRQIHSETMKYISLHNPNPFKPMMLLVFQVLLTDE